MAVVAPAGPAPLDRFDHGLSLLRQRYEVILTYDPRGPLQAPSADHPYLAGGDAARAAAFNTALGDPRVRALFCARGGYGSARVVQLLDAKRMRRRRLPLVGFSDVTVLHAWAAACGVPTIHGPVVTQLVDLPPSDHQALFDLLEGSRAPQVADLVPLRGGTARGPLAGGNLTLLSHLCGTPLAPRLDGAILLLEDVGERPYRIDRKLTQLRHAELLQRAAAVVLGDFTDCDDPQGGPTALAVLGERLCDLDVPVVHGAPVGHGQRNLPLPLGVTAELDADAGTLCFV